MSPSSAKEAVRQLLADLSSVKEGHNDGLIEYLEGATSKRVEDMTREQLWMRKPLD